jgi:putative oxidoreductase
MAEPASIAERVAFGRPLDPVRDPPRPAPRPTTMLVGRILIALIFLASGAGKLMAVDQTVAHMTQEGIGGAGILVYVAAFAELLGGIAILFGFLTRIAAIGLVLFMIPTTFIFHDFWTYDGQEQRMQMINFFKNLVIIGGLTLLIAQGGGAYSVDAKLRAPKPA